MKPSSLLLRSYRNALCAATMITLTASLHAGLVVQLRFDEGEGTTAANSADPSSPGEFSTQGAEWTREVPPTFVPRAAYRNLGEDGAYVSIKAATAALRSFEDFTITGWVRASKVRGTVGGFDRIISKRDKQGSQAFDIGFIEVAPDQSTEIGLGVMAGTAHRIVTRPIDFSKEWLFFAVTRFCDNGEIFIYLGTSDPLLPLELERKGTAAPGPLKNNAPLVIGNTSLNTQRAAKADYSDIRIYDEVLDPGQLEAVRRENLTTSP